MGIYATGRSDRALGRRIQAIQDGFDNLGAIRVPAIRAPALDVKLKVLRKNPEIGTEAQQLLALRGQRPWTEWEFHILFAFYLLTENHTAIADLVRQTEHVDSAIDHVDYAYLLPAVLDEHEGLRELAQVNYLRYLTLMRDLSLSHDLTPDPYYQNRLTFVRLKKEFLQRELPGLRGDYYSVSYFSKFANGFFEHNFTDVDFFQKYWGLIEPYGMNFQSEPLCRFVSESRPELDPFPFYEICASTRDFESVDMIPQPSCSCDMAWLADALPKGDFLRVVSLYSAALRAYHKRDYLLAQRFLHTFEAEIGESSEFLRDDGLFLQAQMFLNEDKRPEGLEILRRLARSPSDQSLRAAYMLSTEGDGRD